MISKLKKIIPSYCLLPLIVAVVFTNLAYFIPKFFYDPGDVYDLSLGIDKTIPFLPIFILFYVLAYLQWIVGFVMIARASGEELYKLTATDMLAKSICCIIFIALPTIIVRPEITEGGFLNGLTSLIYAADTPAINLFPSIHCLESWAVFRCAIKLKLPIGYKIALGLFSLGVFASVLFVKQHFIIDIPAGILVFELAYFIVNRTKLDEKLAKLLTKTKKPSC